MNDSIKQWLQDNPGGNCRIIEKDGLFAANLRVAGKNIIKGPLTGDTSTAMTALNGAIGGNAVAAVAEAAMTEVAEEVPSLAKKLLGSPGKHISTAAYRLGAKKLVKLVREPLIAQLTSFAENDEEKKMAAFFARFMLSPFGDAFVSNAIAGIVAVMPLPAAVAKVIDQQALANELRDRGYTEALEGATDLVIEPLTLMLGAAISQIVPILTQGAAVQLPEQAVSDE